MKGEKKMKRPRPLLVRVPLPKKTEKRHGDAKKYDRKKEKEKLRRELGHPILGPR